MFSIEPKEVDELCCGVDLRLHHRLSLNTNRGGRLLGREFCSRSDVRSLQLSLRLLSWCWTDRADPAVQKSTYLSDHGVGQDLRPFGSTDDVGSLEEDLGSVLNWLQVPLFPGCHRREDGLVDELLKYKEDRCLKSFPSEWGQRSQHGQESCLTSFRRNSPCRRSRTWPPCVNG